MAKTDDDLKSIRAARDAAKTLTETERQWRARHKALVQERRDTFEACQSVDEILANMERLVDDQAAQFARDHGSMIAYQLSDRTEIRGLEERAVRVPARLPEFSMDGTLTFRMLCGLAPELVKARFAAIIRSAEKIRFGLPREARAARLAELDAEIAALEAKHTELCDAAAEVGLQLPLLESVRARREAEAARVERERELAAERAKLAARR